MRGLLLLVMGLSLSLLVLAQNRTITGKITDEQGQPVADASVAIKGQTTGTTSDAVGNYSITVDGNASTLVFSHVSMVPEEIQINGRTVINIALKAASGDLSEVVVSVAYGQQAKKKVTGAIGKLQSSQIENVPMPSVEQILQGKIAGLQSVAPTGQPGAAQQIRIRGIGSISASAEPLFVIDGIPVNTGDISGLTQSSNLLASINPNDIESVTVLKDAASASIYGSRAANGVILINTKKGRAGRTQYRVDAEFGSNDIAYLPDIAKPLTKDEFAELTTEGIFNVGGGQGDVDFILDIFGYNTGANYNWLDLVKRKGQQQQVNVSASGGDARTQFFISGGYFNQQSVVIGSEFKRYSGTLNLKHQASKRLSFGTNLNISSFKQMGEFESAGFRNPIIAGTALLPTQEAYNADGSPNYDPVVFDQIYNPLAVRKYDRQNNNTAKVLGSVNAEFKILDNLKFSTRYGMDYNVVEELLYWNPFFGDGATSDPSTSGQFFNNYTRVSNWVWTNLLDYRFSTLENKIDGTVTVGYESQKSKLFNQAANGSGVPQTTSLTYPSVATPSALGLSGSDYAFVSLLSKADISYEGRYILSGSLRRDGSSRFGSNNRYGTFWSVGFAWNVDQENFFQNIDFISGLKLRASYGVNGNAGIGNYNWRPLYTFGAVTVDNTAYPGTYGGSPASSPSSVGNLDLTWEQNKPLDIGIEVAFLKNRVSIEADYYNRKTDQLLLNEPLSQTSGFSAFNNNVGAMENKGIEVTVNAIPVKTKDFTWSINFNSAWNKNRVTRLREGVNEIIVLPYIYRVGEDIQSVYTRNWAGADPDNGDPLWYKDGSKQETTNDFSQAQRSIVGSASPKGFGGFSTSFNYKFVTLSAQFNYQYGNLVYDQWAFLFLGDGAFGSLNHYKRQLDRWQQPGDITDVPRYDFFNATVSNATSTRYFYKGDYLRLRNITLAFDMPATVLEKMHLNGLSFYVRGANIWTKAFDKNITIDPEQPINGTADLQFYIPKSITVGLNVKL